MSHDNYVVKVGNDYVERSAFVIADSTDPLAVARVTNTAPGASDYGVVVRMIGTVSVTGGGGGAVYGPSSLGVVLSNPPVAIGGVDAGGLLRVIRTDAAGYGLNMITNGTQFMPTMDAAARRGYMTHTDGTNSMPTGDAVARGIYHRITDGVTQVAVKAASTAAVAADPALVVALSPNNNTAALAWFEKITDGTNTAAVKASTTVAAITDPALVTTLSPNLPVPTMSTISSAATTNATSVKASAGTVFNIVCSNTGAAAAYVKFYNKASAPTVGTDVPVFTLTIPASGSVIIPASLIGIRFATGIALAITNLAADSDTTAVVLNQVKVMTSYI
jgi:hypothetical protein